MSVNTVKVCCYGNVLVTEFQTTDVTTVGELYGEMGVDAATMKVVVGGRIPDATSTLEAAGITSANNTVKVIPLAVLCSSCAVVDVASVCQHQCLDCGDVLCDAHLEHHRRRWKQHTIATGPPLLPCRDHPGRFHTIFCNTTNKFICSECACEATHVGCNHVTAVASKLADVRQACPRLEARAELQKHRLAAAFTPADPRRSEALERQRANITETVETIQHLLGGVKETWLRDLEQRANGATSAAAAACCDAVDIDDLLHRQNILLAEGRMEEVHLLQQKITQKLVGCDVQRLVTPIGFAAAGDLAASIASLGRVFGGLNDDAPVAPRACGAFEVDCDGVATAQGAGVTLADVKNLVERAPIAGLVCTLKDVCLDAVLEVLAGTCGDRLTTLSIRDYPALELQHLAKIAEAHPHITHIDVSRSYAATGVGDAGLQLLAEKYGDRLTTLGVGGNGITTRGLGEVADRLPMLTHLDVSNSKLRDGYGFLVGKLLNMPLKHLDISRTEIELGFLAMEEWRLKTLVARSCKFLPQLTLPATLTSLDIAGCLSFPTYITLQAPEALTSLSFGACVRLAERPHEGYLLRQATNLRHLEIFGQKLMGTCGFEHLSRLETLTLRNTDVAWFTGWKHVAQLRHLSMQECRFVRHDETQDTFLEIAKTLHNLESFGVSRNALDEMCSQLGLTLPAGVDVDPMALLRVYRHNTVAHQPANIDDADNVEVQPHQPTPSCPPPVPSRRRPRLDDVLASPDDDAPPLQRRHV